MKNNKEIARMQKLAGIITEGQYRKLVIEEREKFNAFDPSAPDWEDSEGYELLLEDYFMNYNLEDPNEFASEIYENGDAINNLAFDIAQRAGFKGSLQDLLDDSSMDDFNVYCNNLAKLFFLEHGVALGVVDENDSEYQKHLQQANNTLKAYEPKIQSTLDKLQGNIAEANESVNEDDIFDGGFSVSDKAYDRMDSLINRKDYDAFIQSATNMMKDLTDDGFEAKEVFYYLYTRLTADI